MGSWSSSFSILLGRVYVEVFVGVVLVLFFGLGRDVVRVYFVNFLVGLSVYYILINGVILEN